MSRIFVNDSDTLEDLIRSLRRATYNGTIARSSGDSIRTTITRIFKAVYGAEWETVSVNQMLEDDVFGKFKSIKGSDYSDRTMKVYQTRLESALRMYRMGKFARRREDMIRQSGRMEVLKSLEASIQGMQDVFSPYIEQVFSKEARERYDNYIIPVSAGRIAAIALPEQLTEKEKEKIGNIIAGILACK